MGQGSSTQTPRGLRTVGELRGIFASDPKEANRYRQDVASLLKSLAKLVVGEVTDVSTVTAETRVAVSQVSRAVDLVHEHTQLLGSYVPDCIAVLLAETAIRNVVLQKWRQDDLLDFVTHYVYVASGFRVEGGEWVIAANDLALLVERLDKIHLNHSRLDDLLGSSGAIKSYWSDPDTHKSTDAATEPTATEPTATEPTATEPTATEPTATEPTATEPTATEPEPAFTTSAAGARVRQDDEALDHDSDSDSPDEVLRGGGADSDDSENDEVDSLL